MIGFLTQQDFSYNRVIIISLENFNKKKNGQIMKVPL